MDAAFCSIDSRQYFALEFARLDPSEICRLRYSLICLGCGEKAFFRKAASSGQGPTFGARHTDECELASRLSDPWGEAGDEVVQQLEADQTRILLNLGGGGGVSPNEGSAQRARVSGGGRSHSGGLESHRTQIQRNPEKLLRLLVQAPSFRTSPLLISTEQGEIPVHTFFAEMQAADRDRHAGNFHGFWGVPRWTNLWNGVRLFNGAPAPSLGFEITDALIPQVVQKYRLADITDLRSRYVMFLGRPRITQNNSFMMTVSLLSHVAVLPYGPSP